MRSNWFQLPVGLVHRRLGRGRLLSSMEQCAQAFADAVTAFKRFEDALDPDNRFIFQSQSLQSIQRSFWLVAESLGIKEDAISLLQRKG